MTVSKAANTIHPHTIKLRNILWPLVEGRWPKTPKLEYDVKGYPVIRLRFPMTKREQRNVSLAVFRRSATPDTEDVWIREIDVCSNVSKMSAWGFNLPPGPPQLRGTCSGATWGFPSLAPEQRRTVLSSLYDRKPDESQWICSGCYALKGQYATDTPTVSMIGRMLLARSLIAKGRGRFAELMVEAIGSLQARSLRQMDNIRNGRYGYKPEDAHRVNDPEFFRLHDSGDFFSKAYLFEWFDIARALALPRKFRGQRLPAVTIWAPTRVWSVEGALGRGDCPTIEDLSCAPSNLVIRPSSLHYGEAAPALRAHGYAAGATSSARDLQKKANWVCPAYRDAASGGGAVRGEKGKLVGGNCARAQGPGAARGIKDDDRAPVGHGCRVCWSYPELSVVYQEH